MWYKVEVVQPLEKYMLFVDTVAFPLIIERDFDGVEGWEARRKRSHFRVNSFLNNFEINVCIGTVLKPALYSGLVSCVFFCNRKTGKCNKYERNIQNMP